MIGDIYRCGFNTDLENLTGNSALYVRETATPSIQPFELEPVARAFWDTFGDPRRRLMSQDSRVSGVHVVRKTGNPAPPFLIWDNRARGIRGGSLLSLAACIVLQLRQSTFASGADGGLALGGVSQNDQYGGRLLNDFCNNQVQAFCDLIPKPIIESGGGPGRWETGVISTAVLIANGRTPAAWQMAFAPVTRVDYSGRCGAWRKRKVMVTQRGGPDLSIPP